MKNAIFLKQGPKGLGVLKAGRKDSLTYYVIASK